MREMTKSQIYRLECVKAAGPAFKRCFRRCLERLHVPCVYALNAYYIGLPPQINDPFHVSLTRCEKYEQQPSWAAKSPGQL